MEECAVCCCAGYKKVKCVECGYEACVLCTQTYLLNLTNDPRCMKCRCQWSILFLRENMGEAFQQRMLGLLSERSQRRSGFCPCPSCHYGKIHHSTMTCSSCWVEMCEKCLCAKQKEHVCREEDVRSLEKIRETTRRCPGCHVPIEKKSGCFQMFCTYCYTAFDWKDGKILTTDNLHNPHYFDHHKHLNLINSFQQSINNMTNCRQKRKCTELFNLMIDIEKQIDHPEKTSRQQYLLWVSFYKKGLAIMSDAMSFDVCCKIRCFQDDLKEVLMEYNEHVAECLQLRGCRLFPSNSAILCV